MEGVNLCLQISIRRKHIFLRRYQRGIYNGSQQSLSLYYLGYSLS